MENQIQSTEKQVTKPVINVELLKHNLLTNGFARNKFIKHEEPKKDNNKNK